MIWLEPGEYSVKIDQVLGLELGLTVGSCTTACACVTALGKIVAKTVRENNRLRGERRASIASVVPS
jgi:hypothetical protein